MTNCPICGSTDHDEDLTRGVVVCRECGLVLENDLLKSTTSYEDDSSGKKSVAGVFVSNNSTGGSTSFGINGRSNGRPSREITLSNADKAIKSLCNQLGIAEDLSDKAVHYYKRMLELSKTRGRDKNLNYAACIYMACRMQETEYLLIDISEVLQIDVYELGKTYVYFSSVLCLELPSFDPSLYIARYSRELNFGDKTSIVVDTASKLVKRMMKDSIHYGRRPSGLCGAAILIAARLHDFNRTPNDIIKIVQIHESTLRKRLIEFGDTSFSSLTLDEFSSYSKINKKKKDDWTSDDIEYMKKFDKEEEPPSFKASKKKYIEQFKAIEDFDINEFDDLQREIEKQLEKHTSSSSTKQKRKRKITASSSEEVDTNRFIEESTINTINGYISDKSINSNDKIDDNNNELPLGIRPDISAMGLISSLDDTTSNKKTINLFENTNGELDISGIDDDEIDSYILTEKATDIKSNTWTIINADYLNKEKEKEAQRLKDIEEGKPVKKKRNTNKKKNKIQANSAGEAIEKMLQEKKISSKINYDVLKNINPLIDNSQNNINQVVNTTTPVSVQVKPINSVKLSTRSSPIIPSVSRSSRKNVQIETKVETKIETKLSTDNQNNIVVDSTYKNVVKEPEEVYDYDDNENEPEENSIFSQFTKARDGYDDYEDDDYY